NVRGSNIGNLANGINALGRRWGCFTCGAMNPGARGWHMDHFPSRAFSRVPNFPGPVGPPYLIRPQCAACSSSQGGLVGAIVKAVRRGDSIEKIRAMLDALPKARFPWPEL